ncbi:substrate-binding domain-containing protein [Celerinatantimonas sp. YJH-8]|uniref:substrate-binding domain-containing protein n=1 Tax=Celerinatantimonas sp. YJH-8 TaxID=3228714 RepID=UPI0038C02B93
MPYIVQFTRAIRWMLGATFLMLLSISPVSAKFIAVSANLNDTFQNMLLLSMERTADANNDDIYIDYANNDTDRQLAQIRQYVQTGADAIIVSSIKWDDAEYTPKIMDITGKTPLVFVSAEPLHDLSKLPKNVIYVGSNEQESGTMEMEELARLAHYKGKVAMLMGEKIHRAAQSRSQDVKEVIAKYPDMSLVASETADWSRSKAYAITKKWLQDKLDFNILVANNDEMILGAILAFQDSGIDPKPYLLGGIDATPDALQEMQKGLLDVTVLQDANRQGSASVEMAYQLINKERPAPVYWVPFKLITPDNYQQLQDK